MEYNSEDEFRGLEPNLLNETTQILLRNPSSIEKWLILSDKYMQTFAKDPSMFLLPKTHEFLKPLIEAYATNVEGFVQYLVGLRDSFSKEDMAWGQVQSIQRRVNGRFVQQHRRERAQRAISKAEDLYGESDYHSRLKWVADLEHTWAGRRLVYLDKHRDEGKSERLSTDHRAELLLEFWEIIDTEIFEGGVPPWN